MITIPYGKFGGKGWTNGSREPQGDHEGWKDGDEDLDRKCKDHEGGYWYRDEAFKNTGDDEK